MGNAASQRIAGSRASEKIIKRRRIFFFNPDPIKRSSTPRIRKVSLRIFCAPVHNSIVGAFRSVESLETESSKRRKETAAHYYNECQLLNMKLISMTVCVYRERRRGYVILE